MQRNYRGKDIKTEKWVYGWYVEEPDGGAYICLNGAAIECYSIDHSLEIDHAYQVHPSTVSQSTGRKDLHKQDIYGGMKVRDNVGREWIVQFIEDSAAFMLCYAKDLPRRRHFDTLLPEQLPLEIIPEGDRTCQR